MLGGFSVSYEGREITLGRNHTARFVQLLQMVWLNGGGVTKEQLIKYLYNGAEGTALVNANNSFNNLLYQTRLQMVRCGFPEDKYVIKKDGRYIPSDTLPIWIDTVEFEEQVERARQEHEDSGKLRCYWQALELYRGELLPAIANELWVVEASFRLQKMFEESVKWVGGYLKESQDYYQMYLLYTKAASIYPFDDWQLCQIECLLERGDYKEAYALYNKTVSLYVEEMGLPPSRKMLDCYTAISDKVLYHPGELYHIKEEFLEKQPELEAEGAYYCPYPSFIDMYRLCGRNMDRSGKSIFLMLCTLVDYEGKMIQNEEKLRKRSEHLKEAIRSSLRRGDAFTKYSMSQYLILLPETRQEDGSVIFRRISRKLKELAGSRAEIRYNMVSVAEIPVNHRE